MSTGPSPFGFGKGPKYDVQQFNLARTNSPAFMRDMITMFINKEILH
ncbi:MAG: hypothetical protein CM15mV19_1200 [uncultured marine virus]|nr:MAG: hypothetical protein CM15mV19_1200 [uncultured marine virus]